VEGLVIWVDRLLDEGAPCLLQFALLPPDEDLREDEFEEVQSDLLDDQDGGQVGC